METTKDHSQHCRACKERVRQLLTVIYGECRTGHSFPWPSNPQHYQGTAVGRVLESIHKDLQRLRGNRDFIRAEQTPPCDYYLPRVSLIVEFDESQHFTRPRELTLEHYLPELSVGFSIPQWIDLCKRIKAEDLEPPDRDERRAWYDTLRDLVPSLHGFKPTVRVYSEAIGWCSLNKDSKKDLETFRSLLQPPSL